MTFGKILSRKRSEQARRQERDEWGRFRETKLPSNDSDGSSKDTSCTDSSSTVGEGKRVEVSFNSSQDDEIGYKQSEPMVVPKKSSLKDQKAEGGNQKSNTVYIDLISSEEDEIVATTYQSKVNREKKRKAVQKLSQQKRRKDKVTCLCFSLFFF
jgi:hypothetical protein